MTLKAVLFDFNGVILNDEPIHQKLIEQILTVDCLRDLELDRIQAVCNYSAHLVR